MDAVSQPELERLQRAGGADLVVGILDTDHKARLAPLSPWCAKLGIMRRMNQGRAGRGALQQRDWKARAATVPEADSGGQSLAVFSYNLAASGPAGTSQPGMADAYRSVFAVGGKLGVRACGVIASHLQAVTPQWIYRLLQPVLELGFDLVAPRYTRQKMEGLLNRSVLSPLHRALYGVQLQNPAGPDFGLSGKFLQRSGAGFR